MVSIACVVPTYKLETFRYTARALQSFYQHTPDGIAIVVDDATRGMTSGHRDRWAGLSPQVSQFEFHTFSAWGGLTRSWNWGLSAALSTQAEIVVLANSDVVFTPNWWRPMVEAVSRGYSLVGPLSNTPGDTAGRRQRIDAYVRGYQLRDDSEYLDETARQIYDAYSDRYFVSRVNGFFMLASRYAWESGRYDKDHFFRPRNDRMVDGSRNPTPLMTGNEDELQVRWENAGKQSVIACGSFIFHYRAATRGPRYRFGNKWMKMSDLSKEVSAR